MAVENIYLLGNMRFPVGDNTMVFEDNMACIEWSTTSWVGESVPSTLTFGSTSPTKPFRTGTFG